VTHPFILVQMRLADPDIVRAEIFQTFDILSLSPVGIWPAMFLILKNVRN